MSKKRTPLLSTIGARIRALRERRKLSRRVLSQRSGVSERFLAQLEAGEGNISLTRFANVAEALGTDPADLLTGAATPGGNKIIALLGVRGPGKSTIGPLLAKERETPFIEVDREIESRAGLLLGQIFELHGQAYYHKVEREVLTDLFTAGENVVIATGGSIVRHTDNYNLLKRSAVTVWLRAAPQEHWDRVIKQGDSRPMARNPHAFSELKTLLSTREPLYAEADHIVDTSGRTIEEALALVSTALGH